MFTDHLGSFDKVTDESGEVVEMYSFDAWGNRRNPENWQQGDTRTGFLFSRGFTGHEHLDGFKLINMKGRLYDPVVGRFFSPDPYVQAPDFTQNFNRYSYCLNNPLMYTDPSGEWIHLVVGAIIGGTLNWAMNGAEFSWKGLGYFGVGAAAGALGAGIGAGVNSMFIAGGSFAGGFVGTSTVTSTGFIAGALTGASTGMANGFTSGIGNGLLGGDNLEKSLLRGLDQSWKHGLISGLMGGLLGGIDAVSNERNFWTGSYKQYNLKPALLASSDNHTFSDEYVFPKDATVANTDKYKVYYKPEDGVYGTKNYVDPGKYIKKPIDGVATSKYTNKVFKVPDGGKIKVLLGGDIKFTNGFGFYEAMKIADKAGWLILKQLDSSWEMLFKLSLLIK